jgi:hypothetical protein
LHPHVCGALALFSRLCVTTMYRCSENKRRRSACNCHRNAVFVDHAAVRPDSRRVFVAPRDDLPSFSFFWEPYLGVAMKKATRAAGLARGRVRPSTLRPLRRTGPTPDVLWDQGVVLVRRSHTPDEQRRSIRNVVNLFGPPHG